MKKLFFYVSHLSLLLSLYASAGMITNVTTQQQLDQVLYKNKYVVAQFLNPKCPVCIAFKKTGIYPALAQDFSQVKFIEIDVEQAPTLHEKYNIEGATPTFIFFKDTQPVVTYVGRVNKGVFANRIKKAFSFNK